MTLTDTQIAEVTRHNLKVWDRCAPTYTEGFESLTDGATTPLLDLAGVGRDTALLDVGTGPGTLIGPALERGARVSAIDLSPLMVAAAQARHPGVDIVMGDAALLPYPDHTFDAVTLSFCLHHTANPNTVIAEVHRILRPGGRLAFAVWAPPEQLEAFGLAFATIGELVPLQDLPTLQGPAFGTSPSDFELFLTRMGFTCPTSRLLEISWSLADGALIFDGFDRFLNLGDQPEHRREEIRQRLDREVRSRIGVDGQAHLPNPAIIAAATKPTTQKPRNEANG